MSGRAEALHWTTSLRRYRPRIRTVLLLVNLIILLLPVLGIQALKLYENELIRQTEAALIAQGSYLREHFKAEILARLAQSPTNGQPYGIPILPRFEAAEEGIGTPDGASPDNGSYAPIQPNLDLAREQVRPVTSGGGDDGRETGLESDQVASAAGAGLSALLRSSQRYTLAGVRVLDYQGIVVASSRGELNLSLMHREEVMRALTGETLSILRERISDEPAPPLQAISRANRVRVFVALPVVQGNQVYGAVVLSRTPIDLEKALYLNRFVLLRYSIGLVAIVLLVSVLTATTISRPIQALMEQTERIRLDMRGASPEAARPIAHPGSHEVRELSAAIAAMARALHERTSYIETFARNVSHEFKTPLATFQGTVELLRDHLDGMTRAERDRFLGMLASDAQRMEKLVTRLLQLARADTLNPVLTDSGAPKAGLATTAAVVVARFSAQGLAVTLVPTTADTSELTARIAPETLDSLLGNLLENARQHGGKTVTVTVEIAKAILAGRPAASLIVRDDGVGLSPANLSKAFDTFFTTARESGGTGLGLPIVRALVEAHGGTVTLESDGEGHGATSRVVLPTD